jgi:hypothetical protein
MQQQLSNSRAARRVYAKNAERIRANVLGAAVRPRASLAKCSAVEMVSAAARQACDALRPRWGQQQAHGQLA